MGLPLHKLKQAVIKIRLYVANVKTLTALFVRVNGLEKLHF